MALDDDQPLSGAQFARHVGADPAKWAAEFMKAATSHVALSNTERLAFVTAWFRDAMEAAVKAAVGQEWPPSE